MSHLDQVHALTQQLSQRILGQEQLVNRLVTALLCDGHLLVEGAPGLAKTRAIKELSTLIEGNFHRIQFTPDLLPADVTGTDVYRPETGTFIFQPGPIFHNLVLADEINRAPAKVQSALLEAMGERQISVGKTTHKLPELFLVMATQNPIEQEGTYSLPEAQLDRFMMHVKVDYPSAKTEREILRLTRDEALGNQSDQSGARSLLNSDAILAMRKDVLQLHMSEAVEDYIVELVMATRQPKRYNDELANNIAYGASPRATITLDRASRAQAFLQGRDYVTPGDVQEVAFDVLRHRVGLSFEAEAKGVTPDSIIAQIVRLVAAP